MPRRPRRKGVAPGGPAGAVHWYPLPCGSAAVTTEPKPQSAGTEGAMDALVVGANATSTTLPPPSSPKAGATDSSAAVSRAPSLAVKRSTRLVRSTAPPSSSMPSAMTCPAVDATRGASHTIMASETTFAGASACAL